jgi:glycosyltransferase involved in cell wall biosynthesis
VSAGADPIEVVVNARQLSGPHTGTEVYMERLLAALSRTGQVEITAVTSEPLDLGLTRVNEVVAARRPDLRPGSIPATLWKLWFDQWRCLRAVAAAGRVLFHGMVGFLPYSLRARDRAVVTVHDLGWQAHPELFSRRLRMMYGGLFPYAVRRADRFIAVSQYTADDLVRRVGVPAGKIEVIYHGLDPSFIASIPTGGERTGESPYVLAVGGVSPRKNTRRLIAAFEQWRSSGGHRADYRLLITGASLDTDFLQNGAVVPAGVSLLGYVEERDLPGLYAGAAVFLYPGIYEGFGLPIIEAMAAGAPVVTSRTGAAPEIAGGAAVLVDPFDVASIAAGLDQATIPAEAERLREEGRARVGRFDWASAAQSTVEVYRNVIK